MPKTLQVALSDAAIKKHAADLEVGELNDPRHPLRFRYRLKDRGKGSWYVVRRGKWKKAGNWPEINARTMLDNLPLVLSRLQVDPAAVATVGAWSTVGQLLTWYAERVEVGRTLSKPRRSTVLSAIRRQLVPRLGDLPLADLNKTSVDERLYLPLQAERSLAHVRAVFAVLKLACRRAVALDRLPDDPLAGISFGQFNKALIKPKGARLRHTATPALLAHWAESLASRPRHVTFAVLMLAHGTRLNETRLARWQDVDLVNAEWFIPARVTKGGRDHVLPLTAQAVAFLKTHQKRQFVRERYTGAFLFPSTTRPGQPISRAQAFELFTWLGQGEWTSHDLRKLARTTWAELGVDSLVGRLLLNQTLPILEATYVQSTAMARKREALERWHAWLDERGFAALHHATPARSADIDTPVQPAPAVACAATSQPNV
jgi:integrase